MKIRCLKLSRYCKRFYNTAINNQILNLETDFPVRPQWSMKQFMMPETSQTQITKERIQKTCELARLKVNDSEMETLQKDLQDVVKFFEQIQQVDTEGVEPMYTPLMGEEHNCMNHAREDEVTDGNRLEDVMGQRKGSHYFVVPKVVDKHDMDIT